MSPIVIDGIRRMAFDAATVRLARVPRRAGDHCQDAQSTVGDIAIGRGIGGN